MLVPNSHEHGRQSCQNSESDNFTESQEPERDCRISTFLRISRLDFLLHLYSQKYGEEGATFLIKELRDSTGHQYEVGWLAFKRFISLKNVNEITVKTVLSFFIFLFNANKLLPRTIIQYKCSLALPLKLGFNLELGSPPFSTLMKAFLNIRPVESRPEPNWSLDKVLFLLKSRRFNFNVSLSDLTMKTIFLLGLATGARVSELHSLRKGKGFIAFKSVGRKKFLFLAPNPSFLAKNELPTNRRKPIRIEALLNPDGSFNPLCPVYAVKQYLAATTLFKSANLFYNPRTKTPCSRARISQLIRRLVKISQPGVYSRAHDLRAYSCAHAFYGLMTVSRIQSFGGWRSHRTFIQHYLPVHYKSLTRCVALGAPRDASSAGRLQLPGDDC